MNSENVTYQSVLYLKTCQAFDNYIDFCVGGFISVLL
jgi:hypothetical protein